MPDETILPPAPLPLPLPASPSRVLDDTGRQLAALGDAMRLLAESQKSLFDFFVKQSPPPPPPPARQAPPADITGDPGATGARPAALVDFSKLSPLQQIVVGLREAKPQGIVALRRARDPLSPANDGAAQVSNTGAD